MAAYHPTFLRLVAASVTDFFATSAGVDCGPLGESAVLVATKADLLYSSNLGFAGEHIKAALVVTTTRDVLAATPPQREFKSDLTDDDCRDWVGEMVNQIVGNLKRMLAGYGVDFSMGTPTVTNGRDLAITSSSKVGMHMLTFQVAGAKVKVQIAAEIASAVNFDNEPESTEQAAGGDALLF